MHRIDAPGNLANMFTEGDPTVPVEATDVSADWLNAVQEELVGVITQSGQTLVKADNAQLLSALRRFGGGLEYSPTEKKYPVGAVVLASDGKHYKAKAENGTDTSKGAANPVDDLVVWEPFGAIPIGTTEQKGIVEIATDAEALEGIRKDVVITPWHLSLRSRGFARVVNKTEIKTSSSFIFEANKTYYILMVGGGGSGSSGSQSSGGQPGGYGGAGGQQILTSVKYTANTAANVVVAAANGNTSVSGVGTALGRSTAFPGAGGAGGAGVAYTGGGGGASGLGGMPGSPNGGSSGFEADEELAELLGVSLYKGSGGDGGNNAVGGAGTGYGGGGAGGGNPYTSTGGKAGGLGAPGIVVIWEVE